MSEERIKAARLKSRLFGICEGFEAGASVDVKAQENEIEQLEYDLAVAKRREAASDSRLHDVATMCATVEQERDQLAARVKTLEDALRKILDPNSDQWDMAHIAKQALAAKEPPKCDACDVACDGSCVAAKEPK